MPSEVTPAQRAAVRRLVDREVLSSEQADAVLGELASASRPEGTSGPMRGGIWEVLGYAGGALVFGGAALLLQMSWEDLTRLARVAILLVIAVLVAVAGVVVAGGPRGVRAIRPEPSPRRRIVAVLFALTAPLVAMAVSTGGEFEWAVPTTSVGLLVSVAGYLVLPSIPGLLATGGFSVALVFAAVGDWWDGTNGVTAALLVALGAVWIALAVGDLLADRAVGLAGGATIALVGAQWSLGQDSTAWAYGATLVLAVAFFVMYVRWQDLPLLVAGVVGITVAVPEAVWDLTDGALGGPLLVLLSGLVLLAAGVFGLRLRRKTAQRPESSAPVA